MRKSEIIKRLRRDQIRISKIADILESVNYISRDSQKEITFTMFDLINDISEVEVALYNYLKRRGWK